MTPLTSHHHHDCPEHGLSYACTDNPCALPPVLPCVQLGFTCPVCGTTSYNPNDMQHGYCGNCHDWTGDR